MGKLRSRLTYANVVASIALLIAVAGGSAYASGLIGSSQIQNGSIRSVDIGTGQVRGIDILNGSIAGRDINHRTLTGPPDAMLLSHVYTRLKHPNAETGGSVQNIHCDSKGDKVLGGGAWTAPGVALRESRPLTRSESSLPGWRAMAIDVTGVNAGNDDIVSAIYVICATA